MRHNVDLTKVVPAAQLKGEDEEDTQQLEHMLTEAKKYLISFPWCEGLIKSYFGIGVGGIVAVFLFQIKPVSEHVDEWIWIIVGDLPPAYITVDSARNPACALDGYIGAMQKWVEAVEAGRSVEDLIPVNADSTTENAQQLRSRLEFLDKEILSRYSDDLND